MSGLPGSGWSWSGALLGLGAAAGLLLVLAGLPAHRRPGLVERLEPYLRDTPRPSRLLRGAAGAPSLGLAKVLRPWLVDLAGLADRALGGTPSVRRRLERAGRPPDVERFRAEQVIWGAVGAGGSDSPSASSPS